MSDVARERVPLRITGVAPGHIDEIVAYDVTSVQLEQMTDSSWFLCIEDRNGKEWRFWIGASNGRSHVKCVLHDAPSASTQSSQGGAS